MEEITLAERVRRQRWLGAGLVLAAIPVGLIEWAILREAGVSSLSTVAGVAAGVVASGLVVAGWILLARTDPRWSDNQVLAAYALGGLVVWLVSALLDGAGPTGIVEGVLVAMLWPAWLLAWLFGGVLGLPGPML